MLGDVATNGVKKHNLSQFLSVTIHSERVFSLSRVITAIF